MVRIARVVPGLPQHGVPVTSSGDSLLNCLLTAPNRTMRHNGSASASVKQSQRSAPEQASAPGAVSFSAYSDSLLVAASELAAGASVASTSGSALFACCASAAALLGSSAVSAGVLSASSVAVSPLVAPSPSQAAADSLAAAACSAVVRICFILPWRFSHAWPR